MLAPGLRLSAVADCRGARWRRSRGTQRRRASVTLSSSTSSAGRRLQRTRTRASERSGSSFLSPRQRRLVGPCSPLPSRNSVSARLSLRRAARPAVAAISCLQQVGLASRPSHRGASRLAEREEKRVDAGPSGRPLVSTSPGSSFRRPRPGLHPSAPPRPAPPTATQSCACPRALGIPSPPAATAGSAVAQRAQAGEAERGHARQQRGSSSTRRAPAGKCGSGLGEEGGGGKGEVARVCASFLLQLLVLLRVARCRWSLSLLEQMISARRVCGWARLAAKKLYVTVGAGQREVCTSTTQSDDEPRNRSRVRRSRSETSHSRPFLFFLTDRPPAVDPERGTSLWSAQQGQSMAAEHRAAAGRHSSS